MGDVLFAFLAAGAFGLIIFGWGMFTKDGPWQYRDSTYDGKETRDQSRAWFFIFVVIVALLIILSGF